MLRGVCLIRCKADAGTIRAGGLRAEEGAGTDTVVLAAAANKTFDGCRSVGAKRLVLRVASTTRLYQKIEIGQRPRSNLGGGKEGEVILRSQLQDFSNRDVRAAFVGVKRGTYWFLHTSREGCRFGYGFGSEFAQGKQRGIWVGDNRHMVGRILFRRFRRTAPGDNTSATRDELFGAIQIPLVETRAEEG